MLFYHGHPAHFHDRQFWEDVVAQPDMQKRTRRPKHLAEAVYDLSMIENTDTFKLHQCQQASGLDPTGGG